MEEQQVVIYNGIRGERFKQLINSILIRGKISKKYMDILLSEESMKLYSVAFTAESADKDNNYEMYEQLGDVSAGKFIVNYMYKRFPQLQCAKSVKIIARLKINFGSRMTFSSISDRLGFWEYISASEEERQRRKKDLLEDCLESFIGVTEQLIDEETRYGVGYTIVYDILSSFFDEIDISLRYEDLYDAKTRLKELFDVNPVLGSLVYKFERTEVLSISKIYRVVKSADGRGIAQEIFIGEGTAARKPDSEQKAAANALENLRKIGIFREAPEEYKMFCE